jgi:hypothetical protein
MIFSSIGGSIVANVAAEVLRGALQDPDVPEIVGTGRATPPEASTPTPVETLRYDMERVLLITEALWELLKERHGYTDDQLIQHVHRIDAADGKLDGRVTRKAGPTMCGACGRALSRRRPNCIYCGATGDRDIFSR